ncbi:MAG: DNA topoisomerase IV subunit A [Tenericutes bacterium]|jgi:topoisomerase-4 subunit A|nr:DNA topoisomerase IV subunit A [Mycoplasmatota bacterium]
MKDKLEKIKTYSLEEIMGERYSRYAKYIIQDRAIPDVRDGLKPVQRRILYSMYKERNTFDKSYRKSAKTVGDVIGNYHPHGDSSIYDAMVRMSQDWKMRLPYIDMHGNNGSIDGDSPAAHRYTEARLSKIANELLKDIEKDTIIFSPNYDDTTMEPTVLPAKYPNLLVNGTTGISTGYATNIPPHNLGEIIDATIKRIDYPTCTLDEIMQIIKGPDFPTGGIVEGRSGIKSAYKTGRGRIIIRSKTTIEKTKNKSKIIITEIPYEVNKANLVRRIDEIKIDHKIEGIIEIRDESDREGLRIAIDIKKEASVETILNYLFKNTDLQTSYNFNMVAICNRRPKELGIIEILDNYISFQQEVIIRRTKFDYDTATKRLHIVEGLIKCLSILDEVIKVIRASKNKSNAKDNLVQQFLFTEEQAEAIVILQLYRLTNTDVTMLENELKNLNLIVTGLKSILDDEKVLKRVMKEELRKVKNEYKILRLTEIKDEITEIKLDTTNLLPKEDVIVLITKDGYVKRSSTRSYQASNNEKPLMKDLDYIIGIYNMSTLDTLLIFTSFGNYLYVPIYDLPDLKWKELGKHISNIIKLSENEEIISVIPVTNFEEEGNVIIATSGGMIKRTSLKEFKITRYSKPISCIKLKPKDKLINAFLEKEQDIFITTYNGYGLWFDINEISIIGIKAAGVKAINLKEDFVTSLSNFDSEKIDCLSLITHQGTGKRIKLNDLEKSSRARRGLKIIREVKTNPYTILKGFALDSKEFIGLKTDKIKTIKLTELPINDRYSTGSTITKNIINDAYLEMKEPEIFDKYISINNQDAQVINTQMSLEEIDNQLLDVDHILKNN